MDFEALMIFETMFTMIAYKSCSEIVFTEGDIVKVAGYLRFALNHSLSY